MKNSKKVLFISLAVVLALLVAVVAVGAFTISGESVEVMKYIAGVSDECPGYADANGDGAVDVLDVILLIKQGQLADVKLTTLTLDDDNYSIAFNQNILSYTVKLPAGRPPIPRVEATAADGAEIEIIQAYIPDGYDSGTAKITVSDADGESNTYTVRFVFDEALGFVLQYDDRYEFVVDGNGVTYESSNSDVVAVDENGLMHAKKVWSEPVTVTARAEGQVVDTLVIDKVEKAHINLFLVTGQSNAQGCYSNTTMKNTDLLEAQLSNVEKIGRDGVVYSYDFHPITHNTEVYSIKETLYDMNTVRKQGFQSSLGKTWYDLTGEKVVFLQTAYSGAPIQSWLDTERHDEAGTYTSSKRNYYDDTQKAYADLIPLLEDNYEIIRTANFWNQGGTAMESVYSKAEGGYVSPTKDLPLMTDADYYRLFMLMYEDMKEDFGVELWGVFLNRVTPNATSAENKALQSHSDMVPIRSAQYALHNFVDDLSLVSRVGDYAKKTDWSDKTDPGWGFVDTDNVHFTQVGHNERGRVAARNAFAIWFDTTPVQGVEIVGANGRDRLTIADTITLELGEEYRLAGYALPEASGEKTTLTSSDASIVKVDKYGVVRGVAEGKAVITATTESGKTESVNVEIIRPDVVKVIAEPVTYRWDFNDLTEKDGKNNLTLSSCSEHYGADENYTITEEGIYSVGSAAAGSAGYPMRPDFELEKPITLSSRESWTIEWRGKLKENSVLMGPSQTDTNNTDTTYPFIYLFYSTQYSEKYGYPLKIALEREDNNGNNIFLNYGDYRLLNKEMNSWRLGYDVKTKTMTLYYYNAETAEWETVDSKPVGDFDLTFYSLFGRPRSDGYIGYYGNMDYIQVDFMQEYEVKADINYLWDFNDLTSSMDKNDLTISAGTKYNKAEDNYTLTNGVYTVKSVGASNEKLRPDFELEKPITLTDEKSWVIEWRGYATKYGVLLGPKQSGNYTSTTSTYPFIYLYHTNSYSGYGYPLKISLESSDKNGNNIFFDYQDYKNLGKEMNTWRLAYNAETKMMNFYYFNSTTNVWEIVDSNLVESIDWTFYSVFGRAKGTGGLNYYGGMDYLQVIIEK